MTVSGSNGVGQGQADPPNLKWAIGAVIAALLAGAAIFAALIYFKQLDLTGLGSVVLLVAGFVTVTLLMLVASIVLAALGARAPGGALGMPEGSIRALIAMVLILIFAIIGIVVFNAGSPAAEYTSTGLTQAQVDQLRVGNAVVVRQAMETPAASPEPLYTVVIRPGMTPDSHDFGLQLMTTVSTLVVAVAGFYFGSKATAQAVRAGKDFRPPPRPIPGVLGTEPEPEANTSGQNDLDTDETDDGDGPTDDQGDGAGDGDGAGEGDGDGEGEGGGDGAGDGDGPGEGEGGGEGEGEGGGDGAGDGDGAGEGEGEGEGEGGGDGDGAGEGDGEGDGAGDGGDDDDGDGGKGP